MEHPFTAHIESPSSGGEWLREGEDYSSSDYEYDSDEEEYLQLAAPSQEVNESLTKKKFCHSAKMFYQIFSSVNQYESFLKFVSKTKKQIFRIIFRLFLEAIPAETRYKLPEELWEKIWKFTQNAHYKYKSQIPICADNNYYKAGFRATNKGVKMQNLEKERLNEMFGTLGNLHMLVFEVLYKNPHLLQPTAQLELEVGGLSDCYSSAVWRECVQVARTSVLRLQQLNNFLPVNKEKTEGSRRKQGDVELSHNLGQGSVHVSDQQLDVGQVVLRACPCLQVLRHLHSANSPAKTLQSLGSDRGQSDLFCYQQPQIWHGMVTLIPTRLQIIYHIYVSVSYRVLTLIELASTTAWSAMVSVTTVLNTAQEDPEDGGQVILGDVNRFGILHLLSLTPVLCLVVPQ